MIGGVGLGAGVMYLMDPASGNRRRAMLRDQMVSMAHKTEDFASSKSRHLTNKAQGWKHGMESMRDSASSMIDSVKSSISSMTQTKASSDSDMSMA
jgi:hypothetical protein